MPRLAPASAASSTLVPTPSVVATRTGSAKPQAARSNSPPKPPSAAFAPARAVALATGRDPIDQLGAGIDVDARLGIAAAAGCCLSPSCPDR